MTKSQGHRHNKLAGYYERQRNVTARNKATRAAKRARGFKRPHKAKGAGARQPEQHPE